METTIARLVGTVETMANDQGLTQLSDVRKKEMDTKDMTRRSSSYYSPYTSNPYDLGPIGQCSSPQLDTCDFPYDYTVPEYMARAVHNYRDALINTKSQLRSLDGSRCAESMMDFMCKKLITPQCISNTTVRYSSNLLSVSSIWNGTS